MKLRLTRGLRLVLATVLFGIAGVTATSAPASANNCTSCVLVTTSADNSGYRPGYYSWFNFELKNPLTILTTKITLRVTLPEGLGATRDDLSFWPDNGTVDYDPATRLLTVQPESSTGVLGSMNPRDTWNFSLGSAVAEDTTAAELRVTTRVNWATASGVVKTPNTGKDIVLVPAKPYVLETEADFTPSSVASGGASVLNYTISNTGTGGAESIYYYVNIDDRLTVDTSSLPAGCNYEAGGSYESWTGETITYSQYLSCEYEPALGGGQSVNFTVNVTAPSVTGPEEYEATVELSCTSPADGAYDDTDGGDSSALLLLDPPASPELHVVQMGGPKPITMPTADADPLQPTAGKTHSVTTYAYNIGAGDITSDVTVTVTIPDGFTPTSITGETDDTTASAPVCTLSTRTCVFNRLGSTKHGKVVIEGDLSATIRDKTKMTVSAQASASTLTTATDSASFIVAALADVRVALNATGAYVAGSPVTFAMSVKNLGPSGLASPEVTVTLPSGASFDSVPKGCTAKGTSMTCEWTRLEAEDVDGEEFTARFGSLRKASATAKLTTSTPLTKDSTTSDSASKDVASEAVAGAIADAIAASSSGGVLPATGADRDMSALLAALFIAAGLALMVPGLRRRRVL